MRCRIGSSGDGVASPGDTGDIMGALTGRVDLLSGVDAMAAVNRHNKINHKLLKTNKNRKDMFYCGICSQINYVNVIHFSTLCGSLHLLPLWKRAKQKQAGSEDRASLGKKPSTQLSVGSRLLNKYNYILHMEVIHVQRQGIWTFRLFLLVINPHVCSY